jgi:S-DNA-T family DNA segregation ATPase FtsK/SpoIIIE
MPAPSFPIVAVVAPVFTGAALWLIWGSPFALVGAVLGPVMVVAHFLDSRRKHKGQARRDRESSRIASLSRDAETQAAHLSSRAEENRKFPSVAAILDSPGWAPAFDGSTLVRAGSQLREGLHGFPWLVETRAGVAIMGEGVAAEAVFRSLIVGITSRLGPAAVDSDSLWEWPPGIRLSRGHDSLCGVSIVCHGNSIVSIGHRGELSSVVDASIDVTAGWEHIVAQCGEGDTTLDWNDRAACEVGVGRDGVGPIVLGPSSESPHIAIAGRTGSGKSEFIAALLSDWAERHPPHDISWFGFDFKGGATLAPLAQLRNCRGVVTDLDVAGAARAWRAIAAEIPRREQALRDRSVGRIEELQSLSRLVIVIDEFPELIRQIPVAAETISAIARRGRSLGVHLVIASQSASALSRDGLLANLTTRVCFPLGSGHEVAVMLGVTSPQTPRVGRPVVVLSDGTSRVIRVRHDAVHGAVREALGERLPPISGPEITPPVFGTEGFGLIDDPEVANTSPARWTPEDGDVVVVGRRGSGRSTAIAALVRGSVSTQARTAADIRESHGVVVIEDLDSMFTDMADRDRFEFTAEIDRRRLSNPSPVFVFSTTRWMPRVHGSVRNVLVLSTNTREEHSVTGEPLDTFDSDAPPGVGSWKGRRVVVYARTDSMVTDESP